MRATEAERNSVRLIAGMIRRAHDFWRQAANAAEGSNKERAALTSAESCYHHVGLYICNSGSPRFFRLLALEHEAKPLGAKYDDAIDEAWIKAFFGGHNKGDLSGLPDPKEFYSALKAVMKSRSNNGKWYPPKKRAALRRAKALGKPFDSKPGRKKNCHGNL